MDLFLVSRADIFAIYPKILKEILEKDEQKRAKVGYLPKDHVQLPSDIDFQDRVYYRLLTVQRAINEQVESGKTLEEIAATKEKRLWDPEVFSFSVQSTPTGSDVALRIQRRCRHDNPMDFLNPDFLHVWQMDDLIKAAHLLRPKCLEPPDVEKCGFADEHEMRRVYSMIYDVFRYKHIIDQALHHIRFYTRYPDLKFDESRIWLLVYDLHLRNFDDRDSMDRIRQQDLYESVHVQVLHEHIWKHKINLAASLSRMRIQNGALHLSQLLPIHLQDDKVAVAAAVSMVTGWINPFKLTSKSLAVDALAAYGLLECPDTDEGQVPLQPLHYKWDKVCPLFIGCVPADRGRFSRTELVRDDHFVMQDRAFTYGPAVFCRLLGLFDIEGDIVQTHVSSPRSTAYLAALVHQNSRVHAFLAFGAGARLPEYRAYLQALGCHPNSVSHTTVRVFAENYCDYSPNAKLFDRVVGVFCTPPNSYSGVTDPIDLICSRGGDLTMLEVLTESEMSDDSKLRVAQILEQQRESLRVTLARPQVQFCLYETHSVVDAENASMVRRAVELMNRCAHVKHVKLYRDRRRLEAMAEVEGVTVDQLEKLHAMNTPAMAAAKKKLREMELHDDARSAAAAAAAASNALLMAARGVESPAMLTPRVEPQQHQQHNSSSSAENSGNEDNDHPAADDVEANADDDGNDKHNTDRDDTDSDNETLNTARSKRSQMQHTADQRHNKSSPSPIPSPYLAIGSDYAHPVKVPKTDLFETIPIPDVCAYQDGCLQLTETGCFLSLIKRKRVTRMDEKYLIVMAERRGLFGDTNPAKRPKVKQPTKSKKDQELQKKKQHQLERPKSQQRCQSADIERLIDRLLTPTYAVSRQYFVEKISRTNGTVVRRRSDNVCERDCFGKRETAESGVRGVIDETDMYRMWWRQTLQFIRRYRVVDWSGNCERLRKKRRDDLAVAVDYDDGDEDGDDEAEDDNGPVLVLQRRSNVRTLYRCVMKNIVFRDNKSM